MITICKAKIAQIMGKIWKSQLGDSSLLLKKIIVGYVKKEVSLLMKCFLNVNKERAVSNELSPATKNESFVLWPSMTSIVFNPATKKRGIHGFKVMFCNCSDQKAGRSLYEFSSRNWTICWRLKTIKIRPMAQLGNFPEWQCSVKLRKQIQNFLETRRCLTRRTS